MCWQVYTHRMHCATGRPLITDEDKENGTTLIVDPYTDPSYSKVPCKCDKAVCPAFQPGFVDKRTEDTMCLSHRCCEVTETLHRCPRPGWRCQYSAMYHIYENVSGTDWPEAEVPDAGVANWQLDAALLPFETYEFQEAREALFDKGATLLAFREEAAKVRRLLELRGREDPGCRGLERHLRHVLSELAFSAAQFRYRLGVCLELEYDGKGVLPDAPFVERGRRRYDELAVYRAVEPSDRVIKVAPVQEAEPPVQEDERSVQEAERPVQDAEQPELADGLAKLKLEE